MNQKAEDLTVGGWQLLVLTTGGYAKGGGDFRSEVHWILGGKRALRSPLLTLPHADESAALQGHEELVSELSSGAYKLVFGEGSVSLTRV